MWKESSLPVQKKLKRSDEKVDIYKMCIAAWMHGTCQIAYGIVYSFM